MYSQVNETDRELSFQTLYIVYQLACQQVDISEFEIPISHIVQSFLEIEYRVYNQRVCIFMNEFLSVLLMSYKDQEWVVNLFQKSVRIWNEEWEQRVKLDQ